MRVPRISLGKLFNVLQSPVGRMASWPMRNIKAYPSKQMYLYLSLVERKEAEFYHNIDRKGYWFGSNDLFSSLFPDNCWCPCKARNSRIISNINIVMSVVRFYFASYWKPHVPWRPRNNWGECLCTLSDPRTRTSINWSTPSPSPHPLLPTPPQPIYPLQLSAQ